MDGIFTTSVSEDTVDEAPMVYKPMDEIVENIKDTVDILEIIKPVYNFKASEGWWEHEKDIYSSFGSGDIMLSCGMWTLHKHGNEAF